LLSSKSKQPLIKWLLGEVKIFARFIQEHKELKKALLYFLLCFGFYTNAQTFWAQSSGGNNVDEAMDVCTDANGDTYVTGYFTNNAIFHNFNMSSVSAGIPDGFIYKTNSAGQMLWVKQFGGLGTDRGISMKVDGNGNIILCGYYFGPAQFGSFNLNSVSGSQDVFVAKIDPNTGNFLWVKSMGGSLTDIPSAVAIDLNNNIILTGSFQGIATFGASTFTSMTDPSSSLPSYDAFTTKLSSAGSFVWTRIGTAKYNDRGLNVATDNAGDVYVCGQFSDTITFGNVHNNQIMNAVFLIKYSGAAGNEVWFRKAAGTSAIAYGLAIDANNDIYMSGDFTGSMVFYGNTNSLLSGSYTNKIFVTKITSGGNYIWGHADASKNYVSARALTLDNFGAPYIFGEFDCGFTDYQNAVAQGVFNSVGYHDLFVSKYDPANGNRLWERQVGGPSLDEAHGIVITSGGLPLIAGSYMNKISWPMANPVSVYPNFSFIGNYAFYQTTGYCTDGQYNLYMTGYSNGFSDAIVGNLVDLQRQTYDYYVRSGNQCLRPQLNACIQYAYQTQLCPDTIKICPGEYIKAETHTGIDGAIGPYHHFTWDTNLPADTLQLYKPLVSGPRQVTVTTFDGCWNYVDTSYIFIKPVPPVPKITDSKAFNFQQLPQTNSIVMCAPDTVKITGSNIFTNAFNWTGTGPIIAYPDSSILVSKTGTYVITVTNSYSCTSTNSVYVRVDTLYPIIPRIKLADTLKLCCNQYTFVNVYDSLHNPTATNACINLFTSVNWTVIPNTGAVSTVSNCYHPEDGWFSTCTTGNYTIMAVCTISNSCGTATYLISKSFYAVNQYPPLLTYSGNLQFCPGDSTKIVVNHSNPIQWSLGGSINTSNFTNDTVWIKQPGWYYISSTNSLTGCTNYIQFYIAPKPNPILTLYPYLICPNDSVLLTCYMANAVNYSWIGPLGPIPGNTSTKWMKLAGYYHCIVTDADGCVLTSNTIEVKQYNTPFLIAQPSPYLCNNSSVVIKVVTNDSTLIQWLPPLSGGGTVKTVTAAGIYSCQVTMCNIITTATIQVIAANTQASVSASVYSICPSDSTILTANPNMFSYLWQPVNSTSSVISVFEGGNYTLTTTDQYGCSASTVISVYLNTLTPVPSVTNALICYGTSTVLNAAGSGTINWYANPVSGGYLATGNQYTTPTLTSSATYFVSNSVSSSSCSSLRIPVTVNIIQSSYPITASVTGNVCAGDTIKFWTPAVANATYNWSGPNSFTSSLQNPFIAPATVSNSGTYYLYVSGGGCNTNTIALNVNVNQLTTTISASAYSLCPSDSTILTANPNLSNYLWLPGNYTTNIISIFEGGNYTLTAIDSNGCSNTATISISMNTLTPVPTATSVLICYGTSTVLNAAGSGTINWYTNPIIGGYFYTGNQYTTPTLTSSATYYVSNSISTSSCQSSRIPVTVNIVQSSIPTTASVTAQLCAGDSIKFSTPFVANSQYNWSGVNSFTSNLQNPFIAPATAANTGTYNFYLSGGGCYGNTITLNVNVTQLNTPTVVGTQTVCEGQSIYLSASSNSASANFTWTGPNNFTSTAQSITIAPAQLINSGTYYITTELNGCTNMEPGAFYVNVIGIPNVIPVVAASNCVGDTAVFFTNTLSNVSYSWTGPNNFSSNLPSFTISPINNANAGVYCLYADNNGCLSSVNCVTLSSHPLPIVNLGPDTVMCNTGPNLTLTINPFSWMNWQDNSSLNSYVVNYVTGTYWVTVLDSNGCYGSDTINVTFVDCDNFRVPNIITPNGDGANDVFHIDCKYMKGFNMMVFDRWQNQVYESNDAKKAWDGSNLYTKQPCAEGTYFYVIKITGHDDKLKELKGTVSLYR
jgi:gliding motility-associated-like protein